MMNIHEFGKENNEIILLIHPSVVKWDYFENVIPLLQEKYHLLIPALPGYDFENDSDIEIMLSPSKTIGQHFDGITSIEVIINKDKVGELHMDSDCLENSILRYHKYKYVAV